MKNLTSMLFIAGALAPAIVTAEPALTIYNQNFAVVRDTVPLDLQAGVNSVRYTGATAQVEPDSVILRDPGGKHSLQILEQNYRNDPVSQELLLSLFEGRTIGFENFQPKESVEQTTDTKIRVPLIYERKSEKASTQTRKIIQGKIIRSGYVPGGEPQEPIIEVNGKLQFSLPGQPLFPDLGDDTVLKPTLNWLLQSDKPGKFDAEVGYVTGGLDWSASYNLVSPEKGDNVDLVGWITMNNQSGKTFENARIKLMAGDVNKIQPRVMRAMTFGGGGGGAGGFAPPVTEKSFDEFHLYDVARRTTLHDRETKQVEFVHAENVHAPAIYVYDGASDYRFYGGLNTDQGYGQSGNKKILVQREFVNAETNQLGLALPAGKLRFYRRDADGQLQFVGENTIDHTPRNETVRVTTGNSFDLVGERKQTDFKINFSRQWCPDG